MGILSQPNVLDPSGVLLRYCPNTIHSIFLATTSRFCLRSILVITTQLPDLTNTFTKNTMNKKRVFVYLISHRSSVGLATAPMQNQSHLALWAIIVTCSELATLFRNNKTNNTPDKCILQCIIETPCELATTVSLFIKHVRNFHSLLMVC